MQFQHRVGNLKTNDYGALAIRIKTADLKPFQFQVNLTDKAGKTIGTAVFLDQSQLPDLVDTTQNDWFQFTIKMSDFGVSSASIGGIIIWASEPSAFQIDDVRFVQKLDWVMKTPKIINDEYGTHWQNGNCDYPLTYLKKMHNGVDYKAVPYEYVFSASRGFVKDIPNQGRRGYALIIQHESGLTTSYLHLGMPSLTIGSEVQRGTPLGKTGDITGPHLHFGVRIGDFDSLSQAGMMPEKACWITSESGNRAFYPTFPGRFLEPEKIFD